MSDKRIEEARGDVGNQRVDEVSKACGRAYSDGYNAGYNAGRKEYFQKGYQRAIFVLQRCFYRAADPDIATGEAAELVAELLDQAEHDRVVGKKRHDTGASRGKP